MLFRPKLNFDIVRILCGNLLIFVALISLIEVVFRAAYEDGLRLLGSIGETQTAGVFVNMQEKDYFKVAVRDSQIKGADGPDVEYDFVHRERIRQSGDLITLGDFDGLCINIKDGRRVTTSSTGLCEKRVLVFGALQFCAESYLTQ